MPPVYEIPSWAIIFSLLPKAKRHPWRTAISIFFINVRGISK